MYIKLTMHRCVSIDTHPQYIADWIQDSDTHNSEVCEDVPDTQNLDSIMNELDYGTSNCDDTDPLYELALDQLNKLIVYTISDHSNTLDFCNNPLKEIPSVFSTLNNLKILTLKSCSLPSITNLPQHITIIIRII